MAKEMLQVLNALDVAKAQRYHFTAIIIAGMGFFIDAYDLSCISLCANLLGLITTVLMVQPSLQAHCLPV
ncbi:hypothetical protein ACB092_12G164800 [Castanea dentata]